MSRRKITPQPWANRLVRQADVPPSELVANPHNPRTHPKAQREVLVGSLSELGWIAPVIVNETTGHVVDGHARIAEALARGEPTVPVAYVRLSPEEERLALAIFDPITGLAELDAARLGALLREVQSGEAAVQQLLQDLAEQAGLQAPEVAFPELDESAADEVEYLECPACGHRWPK
jgi:ParB-like chromosome segregation protein Spo0J